MNVREILETIQFEAGIPDIDSLGGWLEQEFQRTYDELVGAVQYPELYVGDRIIAAIAPDQPSFQLPNDFIRLDEDNVQWWPGAVEDDSFFLTKRTKPWGFNEGPAFSFAIRADFIDIFPYDEVEIGDELRFGYWRRAFVLGTTDVDSLLIPHQLGPTIIKEMVQKATAIMGDNKRFQMAMALGNRSYSRSFGITEQSDC